MRLRDCDCRTNLDAFLVDIFLVKPGCKMSIGIHRDNLLGISPLRKRADSNCRLGIGKVWLVIWLELIDCESKGMVYAVRTAMSTNCCSIVDSMSALSP